MKTFAKRFGIGTAVALGALLMTYLAVHTMAQPASVDADKQALRVIKAAYEDAINQDNFSTLAPHLAGSFSATMATGQKVNGAGEFEAYWKTMRELIGIGKGKAGRYTVKVEPIDTFFLNDYAFSFGTTKEDMVTDTVDKLGAKVSNSYRFNSMWFALSAKDNGAWKLMAGNITVDPFRTVFSESKVAEIRKLASAKLGK